MGSIPAQSAKASRQVRLNGGSDFHGHRTARQKLREVRPDLPLNEVRITTSGAIADAMGRDREAFWREFPYQNSRTRNRVPH